tara:strand:+ start:18473 stop:19048 length:576 start_codon:yes stop_codon:yes gene_type:complete
MIKSYLLTFLAVILFPIVCTAELIQLQLNGVAITSQSVTSIEHSDVTIVLAEGDIAEVISIAGNGDTAYLEVIFANDTHFLPLIGTDNGDDARRDYIILGPVSITLTNRGSLDATTPPTLRYLTLIEVTRGGIQSGGIPLPYDDNDPTATYKVFMQVSPDLQTWSFARPGGYDASGGDQFFRVHMVKKKRR